MAELNLDGSMTVLRPGTNEWICIPGDQNIVGAADMCADPMGMVWIKDPMAGKPEPTNTSPGLIYMLNGATQRSFTDPFDQTSPAIPIGRTRCTSGRSTRRPPGSAPSCGARAWSPGAAP